jgi:hypothetical protein
LADAKRDHMFMTVAVGGATYVVDPGFGPFAPRFPVPLVDSPAGVMNRNATFLHGAEGSTAMEPADRSALRGLLAEHFGFDLPEVERLAVPAIPEWT